MQEILIFKLRCQSYEILCPVDTWASSQGKYSDLFEDHEIFSFMRSKDENFSLAILMYVKREILVGYKCILSHF